MHKIIPVFYSEYGRYINRFRAIPSYIDGLKPVERRLLLTLHEEAKNKFVKSARVIGTCLGKYHPHGDCLDYNTEIYSLDGNCYKIGELEQNNVKQLQVLAFDNNTQTIVPTIAHSFRVGQVTNKIYKITLSNGSIIKCTENHPIKLENGNYIQAKDLKLYSVLESGVIYNEDRPRIKYRNSKLIQICDIIKNYCKWTCEIVHHIDQNPKNNTHSNLQRNHVSEKNISKYFQTTNLNELSKICSESGFLTYITSIEIENLKEPIKMYDFTVNNFENVYIVNGKKDNKFFITNVHNSSLYGTLCNLVDQEYAVGQGAWGSPGLIDSEAAAYRYTEVRLAKWVEELAFQYIKYVPYDEFELEPEPIYLPCPVPIGLVGNGVITGISFYRTLIPKYKLKDLFKRLFYLLNKKSNISPSQILPNFNYCGIQNTPIQINNILTNGIGTLTIVPNGELDNKNKAIKIYGKVPNASFNSLQKNAEELEINIIDLSDNKLNISIEPKRKGTDLQKLGENIWSEYLTRNLNFNCLFCDNDGKVQPYGIDEILLNNYNLWKYSVKLKKIDDFDKLTNRKIEFLIVQIIRYIFETYKSNMVSEIISRYHELKKDHNINIQIEKYDIDTNKWSTEIKNITDEDIISVCNKRSIKNLVETKIDVQNVEKDLTSAKSIINNNEIECLNFIEMMTK
ncbi:MAG: DNA gyrase subunit A [Candidatus Caldatribacteriota bacterium]|nr:hypothetical protein [Patescibacteria group bacterium]